MQISSPDFPDGGRIPATFAFATADPETHARLSDNVSPQLDFADVPDGARSLVLLCVDPDVPSVGDDVNVEGRTVSQDLPRVEFSHWILANLPADSRGLARGEGGQGVTPGGKSAIEGPQGSRQGVNDFTGWFAGDPEMAGLYRGYDGPGPPWNDERLHRYLFCLYALDVAELELSDAFELADVRAAMEGHLLAEAVHTGSYSTWPPLLADG